MQGQNINKFIDANINSENELVDYGKYFIIQKIKGGKFIHKIIHHKTGVVTHLDTYLSSDISSVKNGLSIRRSFDGTVISKGMYTEDKKYGPWIENVFETGIYKDGIREDVWKKYTNNFKNGLKVVEQKNGTKEKILDLENANVAYLDTTYGDGNTIDRSKNTINIYHNFISLRCKGLGMESEELASCTLKELQFDLLDPTYNYLSYSMENKKDLTIQFIFNTDGSIQSCEVLNGLTEKLKKKLNKVLNRLPKKYYVNASIDEFNKYYFFTLDYKMKLIK